MIYIEYIVVAALVVFMSIKASNYIDLLDKNTNLSGAFLGGVMLSAVTSLPELFTSISSVMMIHKPGLCMGNILGSNLFNLTALSVVILFAFKGFAGSKVAKSYRYVAVFVACINLVIGLNFYGILDIDIYTVSITSLIIIVLYFMGAKYLASKPDEIADEDTNKFEDSLTTNLTIKQIIIRFIIVSIGIVFFSIIITYITDEISIKLNLGAGLAGAIFLGVATSLPELTSTITLFKMKNYDVAVGNIIGSNLFNFIILAIADIISIKGGSVYATPDAQTMNLFIFGFIATPLFWAMIKFRKKWVQGICTVGIIGCYFAFLLIK